MKELMSLQWRHNGQDGVSNHQHNDWFLKRLFRRRSQKTSKLRVTGLCAGNSPVPGELPAQRASNAENVSIWWRHHDSSQKSAPYIVDDGLTFRSGDIEYGADYLIAPSGAMSRHDGQKYGCSWSHSRMEFLTVICKLCSKCAIPYRWFWGTIKIIIQNKPTTFTTLYIIRQNSSHSVGAWHHQMETFPVLLALCAGNSPVTGEFPSQRPVTRSFDVFFDLRLNECLSKQS